MPEPTEETREKYNSLIQRCRSLEGKIGYQSIELDELTQKKNENKNNSLVKQGRILRKIKEKQEKLDRYKKEDKKTFLQIQTEFNLSHIEGSLAIKGNRR